MSKISEYTKLMQQVDEPGIRDPKVLRESINSNLSNQKNSMTNAVLAYSKMTGAQQPLKEQKQQPKAVDKLRLMGAVQAIKEILEGKQGMKKETAEDTFNSIKKIVESV